MGNNNEDSRPTYFDDTVQQRQREKHLLQQQSWRRMLLLIIAITVHNIPEGLAVSLPLRASGYSALKSFWYGQLSGMVEPMAGLLGAAAVGLAEPILPYALAFAAGAMIFVVVDDLIPEAATGSNGRLASIATIAGFVLMMCLDVGLG